MLAEAGWDVQDRATMNLAAATGVAVRESRTGGGPADYLLFLGNFLVGVVEAKKAGVTLSTVEAQTRDYASKALKHLQVPVRPLPFLYESTVSLRVRIEKGLTEIEGRLSRRLGGDGAVRAPDPVSPPATSTVASPVPEADQPSHSARDELPKEASVAFRIGRDLVWGPSASQFYVAVWRWLFEHGHVRISDLPIESGKARYAVAATPVHPSGKEFTRAEQPVPGVFAEVNLSRGDILRRAQKVLGQHGVPFSVVIGGE